MTVADYLPIGEPDAPLMYCTRCGGVVPRDQQWRHDDFHDRITSGETL